MGIAPREDYDLKQKAPMQAGCFLSSSRTRRFGLFYDTYKRSISVKENVSQSARRTRDTIANRT